jgi:hypothetical protein
VCFTRSDATAAAAADDDDDDACVLLLLLLLLNLIWRLSSSSCSSSSRLSIVSGGDAVRVGTAARRRACNGATASAIGLRVRAAGAATALVGGA